MQKEHSVHFDSVRRALDMTYYVGHKKKTKQKTLGLAVYSFDEKFLLDVMAIFKIVPVCGKDRKKSWKLAKLYFRTRSF